MPVVTVVKNRESRQTVVQVVREVTIVMSRDSRHSSASETVLTVVISKNIRQSCHNSNRSDK